MHALKIENLNLEPAKANALISVLKDFAEQLGYGKDRISELECRSRDGFIPFSHNNGGIECVAFADQESAHCMGGTGFENADATIEKYRDYDVERYEEEINRKYVDWSEEDTERFEELYRLGGDEETVLFSLDIMHTGIERGIHTVNLRFCICVKDAPYHRKYDDKFEFDLTFRKIESLERKLKKLLKDQNVMQFSNCLRDAY
jgi:hypothetical protein